MYILQGQGHISLYHWPLQLIIPTILDDSVLDDSDTFLDISILNIPVLNIYTLSSIAWWLILSLLLDFSSSNQ